MQAGLKWGNAVLVNGRCMLCGLGLTRNSPLFYRLTIETHALDVEAAKKNPKANDVATRVMGTAESGVVCLDCHINGGVEEKGDTKEVVSKLVDQHGN